MLPHFDYCSTLLYASQQGTKDRLQLLQNKAMRAILKCSIYSPIRVMLDTLKWMNIEQRLILSAMMFIYKMRNSMLPEYLESNLVSVRDVQPYNLRNSYNLRPNRCNSSSAQCSLMYKGLNFFNSLPSEIKTESSILVFKQKLISFIKSNY